MVRHSFSKLARNSLLCLFLILLFSEVSRSGDPNESYKKLEEMKDPVTIMINFLGHQSPKSQSKSEDPRNIKPSDTEAGLPQNSNANNSAIHKDTRDKDKSSASEHPDASTSSRGTL